MRESPIQPGFLQFPRTSEGPLGLPRAPESLCRAGDRTRAATFRRRGGSDAGSLAPGRGSVIRQDEFGDARHDLRAEARTVEHAVMTNARSEVMRLAVGRDVDAK